MTSIRSRYISVIQWNCRGYRGNFEDLKALIGDSNPDCICLQETFHGDITPHPPRGYTSIAAQAIVPYDPHVRPSRGVITLIKQDVPYYQINLQTSLGAIAIRINLEREYTACNIYISPNETLESNNLYNLIDQLPRPFLLVGDFNARSDVWGDNTTNPHGRKIEDLLINNDICILNTGSPTHLHIQTGTESCIDLTLASPELLGDFDWGVMEDSFNSDHFPIKISKICNVPSNNLPQSYNLDKANWDSYKRLTAVSNNLFDENEDIDSLIDQFNKIVHTAASNSIPKKSPSNRYPIPWWNAECSISQKERKKAIRKYRRTKNLIDKIALNKATAKARKLKRISRKQSWSDYAGSINSDMPINKHWIKISKIKGKYRGHKAICLIENNTPITDQVQVANTFASHFSSISSNNFYSDRFNATREQAENIPLDFNTTKHFDYNNEISKEEFHAALGRCQDKAPGEDQISYSMISNLSQSAQMFLLFIFNQIYRRNEFPSAWRQSTLIPIAKPDKLKTSKNSYRPISLTSSVCKLLEKIINSRLVHTLEISQFFSPFQYGFRKARSTIDPLTKLQTEIYRSFKNKYHTIAIFFDIQKAYDTTWRYHILKTIHQAGIKGNMAFFIQNFLCNRTFKVKIGSTISDPFPQEQGVPQGSVLSVTLFGVAINGIVGGIPPDIQRSLFVDDLAIYFSSPSINTIERRLQIAIEKILEFTKMTGFQISAEKTVAVHFHRKRGLQPEPSLLMEGNPIKFEQTTKFLGMIFDQRLYWSVHITHLKSKCLKSIDILKCLSGLHWGADRQSLLRVYRATTRAQLDYGCQVYASAPERFLKKLDAIHHQAIRLCTGAFRSSPIPSLLADASELSLENRRKQLILQLYYRQQRLPDSPPSVTSADSSYDPLFQDDPHSKPFGVLARHLVSSIDIPQPQIIPEKIPTVPPWLLSKLLNQLTCKFELAQRKNDYPPSIVKGMFTNHQQTVHFTTKHVYTDGSKSSSGAGLGVYSTESSISLRINNAASNYSAELYAILEALNNIKSNTNRNSTIFTDSQSCIQGIADINSPHPIIQNIQAILLELHNSNKPIKLCWIPAHVGVAGNEEADKLAKAGTGKNLISYNAIPCSDIYPIIKSKIKRMWQEEWTRIPTVNKLRRLKNSIMDWNTTLPNRRRLEVVICRLRLGHTRLTHGHYMERRAANDCDFCGGIPLTVEHFLCECPQYNLKRITHFGRRYPALSDLIGQNLVLDPLIKYLQETNIFKDI